MPARHAETPVLRQARKPRPVRPKHLVAPIVDTDYPDAMARVIATSAATVDGWRSLRAAAVRRYRQGPPDPFGWRFARGKLGFDPVFRHLLADGLIAPGARVLDLGCGQGLVASLVAAADDLVRDGAWPSDWPPAPIGAHVTGIELMPREAARARTALGGGRGEVLCGDLREMPFPAADTVLLLDVLHYLEPAAQDRVLSRARAALPRDGRLVLRVGDAGAGGGFRRSLWVDRLVALCGRRRSVPLHGRPLAAWTERLQALGFAVEPQPMSQGTPFANVLLVARVLADVADVVGVAGVAAEPAP